MKKLVLLIFVISASVRSQDLDFNNYLLIGVEGAEELTAIYLEPLSEGITYALTGGWYKSAAVRDKWSLGLSLVTNGSFIPSERLSKDLNIGEIENLEVVGGGNIVAIPTILGSKESTVTLIATVDGDQITFDAPTGIGLINLNLLPSAFLQAELGLPANFELGLRYFPKINVSDVTLGMTGIGLKHEISKSIKALDRGPLAVSGMVAFTRLSTDYSFRTDGFVRGENQFAEGHINTWLFELIASTKNPVYNLYGGIGYVQGEAEYALKGTYIIQTENDTIIFQDPFDVQNSVSGWRLNLGASVRMGWFNLNLGYTFQGFNNLSLGLNFDVLNSKRN
ncbi:MAG: DUF6588 family protein [Bacteroidota bacterium]